MSGRNEQHQSSSFIILLNLLIYNDILCHLCTITPDSNRSSLSLVMMRRFYSLLHARSLPFGILCIAFPSCVSSFLRFLVWLLGGKKKLVCVYTSWTKIVHSVILNYGHSNDHDAFYISALLWNVCWRGEGIKWSLQFFVISRINCGQRYSMDRHRRRRFWV